MTRRLVWLATGVGIGVAVSQRISRSPHGSAAVSAASSVVARARRVVNEAVADGRAEMRRREASLREVLAAAGAEGGDGLREGKR
jgi:predicted NBD/HSP70 family sugar kinase